jgi:hypothetical protein
MRNIKIYEKNGLFVIEIDGEIFCEKKSIKKWVEYAFDELLWGKPTVMFEIKNRGVTYETKIDELAFEELEIFCNESKK